MSLDHAVYARLSADAGVSALVATRIYPEMDLDINANPQIVYTVEEKALAANEVGMSGQYLPRYTVKIVCIDNTNDGAKALRDAVHTSFDNGEGTWGGIPILLVDPQGTESSVYSIDGAQERKFFAADATYEIVSR